MSPRHSAPQARDICTARLRKVLFSAIVAYHWSRSGSSHTLQSILLPASLTYLPRTLRHRHEVSSRVRHRPAIGPPSPSQKPIVTRVHTGVRRDPRSRTTVSRFIAAYETCACRYEAELRPTARWHPTCETEHDAADSRLSPTHRTSDHITSCMSQQCQRHYRAHCSRHCESHSVDQDNHLATFQKATRKPSIPRTRTRLPCRYT
jgi:hypothetical protein